MVSELKEILRSFTFWTGSVMTAFLMGTQGFVAKDANAYSMKNIWEVLLLERKFPAGESFRSLISAGHLGVYTYFIPLLASFCYLFFQAQYRRFGFERIVKIRLPKKMYRRTEYLSSLLVGGLALTAGHFLYVMVVSILAGIRFDLFLNGSCFCYIMQTAVEAFLAGMFWNSIVYVLLHIVRNIYLLGTLPFLLKYTWGCVNNYIFMYYPSLFPKFKDLFLFFDDDGIYYIASLGIKGSFIIGLLLLVLLINYAIPILLERRQIDYGMY
jgi:hypothetical protein